MAAIVTPTTNHTTPDAVTERILRDAPGPVPSAEARELELEKLAITHALDQIDAYLAALLPSEPVAKKSAAKKPSAKKPSAPKPELPELAAAIAAATGLDGIELKSSPKGDYFRLIYDGKSVAAVRTASTLLPPYRKENRVSGSPAQIAAAIVKFTEQAS